MECTYTTSGSSSKGVYASGILAHHSGGVTLINCSVVDSTIMVTGASNNKCYIAGIFSTDSNSDYTLSNCLSDATLIVNGLTVGQRHQMATVSPNGEAILINCVYNNDKVVACNATVNETNCFSGTTEEIKTNANNAIIDILNTDLEKPIWYMDLEGRANLYPITK